MLSVSYAGKNAYSAGKTSGVLRGGASIFLTPPHRGQTDRGYKKTEPDPDIGSLLFVSFKRNRIF